MNIGIILAAGISSRFNQNVQKQLFEIDGKPVVNHSIDTMQFLDDLIIVTNSNCQINAKNKILINDINCRLESIKVALDYLGDKKNINIIIHDAARPFVPKNYFEQLIDSNKNFLYSHYCLKLVNGLARKTESGYEIVDRDQFIELCTPQIVDFGLYNFIFRKYMMQPNRVSWEILPIMDHLKIKYNLIEGSIKYLRKITTTEDI